MKATRRKKDTSLNPKEKQNKNNNINQKETKHPKNQSPAQKVPRKENIGF